MNGKWIAASLTLTLCAAVGGVAFTLPWTDSTGPKAPTNYLRIELPPVEKVELEQLTEQDAMVILREASEEQAPLADSEAVPEPGFGSDLTEQAQALVMDRPAQSAEEAAAGRADGLLDVNFDLAEPANLGGSALDLRKGVRFNGTDAGTATIRVGNGSALYIASDDLRTLLVAAKRNDLADNLAESGAGSFVGFDEVRQNGLNMRYDPLADRILISG